MIIFLRFFLVPLVALLGIIGLCKLCPRGEVHDPSFLAPQEAFQSSALTSQQAFQSRPSVLAQQQAFQSRPPVLAPRPATQAFSEVCGDASWETAARLAEQQRVAMPTNAVSLVQEGAARIALFSQNLEKLLADAARKIAKDVLDPLEEKASEGITEAVDAHGLEVHLRVDGDHVDTAMIQDSKSLYRLARSHLALRKLEASGKNIQTSRFSKRLSETRKECGADEDALELMETVVNEVDSGDVIGNEKGDTPGTARWWFGRVDAFCRKYGEPEGMKEFCEKEFWSGPQGEALEKDKIWVERLLGNEEIKELKVSCKTALPGDASVEVPYNNEELRSINDKKFERVRLIRCTAEVDNEAF